MTDLPPDPHEPDDARQPPADTPPPPSDPTPPPAQWPQPSAGTPGPSGMAASEQRNWAVGAHIGSLATSLVLGLAVLAPLVVYLVKKDEDAFVREHARESLNFQLTWLVAGLVATVAGVILTFVTVGLALVALLPLGIGFAIAWLVLMIRASIAASRGEHYRYPLTVRLIS